ncbi:MAG: FAD-binding oxidoreductase [Woeseia sp.]|nr:FAD-binding oxidoreductase [Woeseia sp.]
MSTIEAESYTVAANWDLSGLPAPTLPDAADVVIIGGGIVGVSTAWFLAKQNINVVLCEKGRVACEQSGRNWGWVRQQGRDPRELPLMIESRRVWETLENDIQQDVGFRECGCLFMARTERDEERLASWLPVAREYGLDTKIISGAALENTLGSNSQQWRSALYTGSDCRAEPHKAAPAIATAAERAGARILTNCAVRGIDTSAGVTSGVVTEHGRIAAPIVLCAAGAWTSMFCRSLGIRVPQLKVRGTVVRTGAAPKVLDGCVFDDLVGIRRRQDGGYTVAHGSILDHSITPTTLRYARKFLPALRQELNVLRLSIGADFVEELRMPTRWDLEKPAPFEKKRLLNPAPNAKVLDGIRKNLATAFPALKDVPIVESWAGMVETSPDVLPIIGGHADLPGFFVASGFSGHGFGIGPGAGKVIADMLTGANTGYDLAPFRLQRFFDGSPIEPMKSV